MPDQQLFIGIDVGTSACRACAIDSQGIELANTRVQLPAPVQDGTHIEQNPSLWWDALIQVLDRLCALIDTSAVKHIAVDGTSSTLLLCTQTGDPLGAALMYNDNRAIRQAERIAGVAPPDSPVRSASSSLAKLLWLLEQNPENERLALHQADWLSGKLIGRFNFSDENNSLKLGYDPVRHCWPEWLGQLGLPAHCLPVVHPPGTLLDPLLEEFRQRWGFTEDTRLVAGTTDSTAGFIATGALKTGAAVTVLGSTLVLKVLSGKPINAPGYGVYSHRLGDHWLTGGASNSGGAVLKQYFTDQQLTALSRQIDPLQPAGLDYYPLPGIGERFPINDSSLKPLLEPRPASDTLFLHGLLEGIARIEQRGYRLLAELGAPYPERVITVGGGAANLQWSKIRERLLGVPVLCADHQEAAYGTALLARGLE